MTQAAPVAIFVDRPDWHARGLIAAFAARGIEAVPVPLRDCGFAVRETASITIPGFEERLPDGGFVRCLPGGSFEQVTLRLSVLHALGEAGVFLCNHARAIERCVDKAMTTYLLRRAGLQTPPTWVCETLEAAARIVAREAGKERPLVLKPLFGSQGRGLRLIEAERDLPEPEEVAGVYYLQRYVSVEGPGWRDWRILVAGDRVIAGMLRRGKDWITNVKQGATCEQITPDRELSDLAVAAARALGAGYAGIDIIRARGGAVTLLEVNSMPAWSALQGVSDLDVSQALVDSFLEQRTRFSQAHRVRPSDRLAAGA